MSELKIEWRWKTKGQFHIGSGIGRVGYADSVLRSDGNGNIFIPGDAVKGAIREGAERLLHWLLPARSKDAPKLSFPDHPILEGIFAPKRYKPFYRFFPGKHHGADSMCPASTAIDNQTGVADDTTLRILETLAPGVEFDVSVTGEGGDWLPPDASHPVGGDKKLTSDQLDVLFLLAALLAVEAIGGKKGIGHGEVAVEGLTCKGDDTDILTTLLPNGKWKTALVEQLKGYTELGMEGGRQ